MCSLQELKSSEATQTLYHEELFITQHVYKLEHLVLILLDLQMLFLNSEIDQNQTYMFWSVTLQFKNKKSKD